MVTFPSDMLNLACAIGIPLKRHSTPCLKRLTDVCLSVIQTGSIAGKAMSK